MHKQILQNYYSLTPPSKYIKYHNDSVRSTDEHHQLERVFYAFSIFLVNNCEKFQNPYVLMITASHNPIGSNGFKLEPIDEKVPFDSAEVEIILNNEKQFEQMARKIEKKDSKKIVNCFIGRDTRPTSHKLSEIIMKSLLNLGQKVIDIGETTTPQIFSLSEYMFKRINQDLLNNFNCLKLSFYSQIKQSFTELVKLIQQKHQFKWQTKSIYIDFSNGAGAISFQNYQFLSNFFTITTAFDKQFHRPNEKCGAAYLYDHFSKNNLAYDFKEADHHYFFDGDCDRIICRINQGALADGNDLNACFLLLIDRLLQNINKQQFKIGCVTSNIVNEGFCHFVESKLAIKVQKCAVGIKYLSKAATKYDICTFFEPNGHGGIYFSSKMIHFLSSTESWESTVLLLIHNLSKNSIRGYSLHNMLILEIYMFLFQTEQVHYFAKEHIIQKSYKINQGEELFVNSKDGESLIEPADLVAKINEIESNADVVINIRRSNTESLLRLTIQGSQIKCKQIFPVLEAMIRKAVSKKS